MCGAGSGLEVKARGSPRGPEVHVTPSAKRKFGTHGRQMYVVRTALERTPSNDAFGPPEPCQSGLTQTGAAFARPGGSM